MITVDTITDAVVKALQEREGLSYSAAICAMTTNTALKDAGLVKVINTIVKGSTEQRLAENGWHGTLACLGCWLSNWCKGRRNRCHGTKRVRPHGK